MQNVQRFLRPSLRMMAVGTAALAAGCAGSLPPLPLLPEPLPWADTLPIAEPPARSEGRTTRALTIHVPYALAGPLLPRGREALNRTHFDDVVSSSWWERRMGYEDITPAQLAFGRFLPDAAPATDGVLRVRSAKIDGATPGFVMEDAKGDLYVMKFDPMDAPYLQSTAGVVANRLVWGAGYWVPDDFLTTLDSANLTVAQGAEAEEGGRSRPMTIDDVRAVLSRASILPDGRFRALASRFVPGTPKGPSFFIGVREDDANDHFRHEHRRELRGLRVISMWLNDTDRREGNTLDVWIDPPGYLRHYQIDFGASLGSNTLRPKHPKDDAERPVSFWRSLGRFLSLGLTLDSWQSEPHVVLHPAVGFLRSETFHPDAWKSSWENPAFSAMTEADGYWAAKIISTFTDAHIRAAVEQGEMPEAWLTDVLTQILALRRDKVVRRYFSGVTPIEDPRIIGVGDCGFGLSIRDLGLEQGLWGHEQTQYVWELSHPARGIKASGKSPGEPAGLPSFEVTWHEGARSGTGLEGLDALATLRILAVRDVLTRGTSTPRAATVWLHWDGAAGRYRVVGLEH